MQNIFLKIYFLLNIILVFTITSVFAQEQKEISGKVLDLKTKQPLAYANIFIKGKTTGTVSNEDGDFILKLSQIKPFDSLHVNYLGYKSLVKAISTINKPELVILLEQIPVSMDEVIIRPLDPVKLLTSAIDRIPENYPDKPAMLTAFYRETVKSKDEYIELSEAVLSVYKQGYQNTTKKKETDQIKLLKGKRTEGTKKIETANSFSVLGGPNDLVNKDRRQLKKEFLNKKKFKYYDYKYKGIISYEDRHVYQIDFDQKDTVSKALYKGSIYLDVKDLAFVRLQFGLSPAGLKKARPGLKTRAILSIIGLEFELLQDDNLIDSRKINNKWYLNYVNTMNHMKMTKLKTKVTDDLTIYNEILVTSIDTVNVKPFAEQETLKSKEALAKNVGDYDEAFWENYNYVKQSNSIKEIEKQLKEGKN